MLTFTRDGYVTVWRGPVFISRHLQEREAIESISGREPGDYLLRYPDVRVQYTVFKQGAMPPAAPTSLVLVGVIDQGHVTLDWNDNAEPGLTGYKVYHSTDNVTFTVIATASFSNYSSTYGLLAPAVTHYFKVTAIASAFESGFSNTVQGNDLTAPVAPTGLIVVTYTGTTVTLDWDNNAEVDFAYYRVYQSTDNITYALITVGNNLVNSIFVAIGLLPSTLYYFKVTATDQSGNESARSAAVSRVTALSAVIPLRDQAGNLTGLYGPANDPEGVFFGRTDLVSGDTWKFNGLAGYTFAERIGGSYGSITGPAGTVAFGWTVFVGLGGTITGTKTLTLS